MGRYVDNTATCCKTARTAFTTFKENILHGLISHMNMDTMQLLVLHHLCPILGCKMLHSQLIFSSTEDFVINTVHVV